MIKNRRLFFQTVYRTYPCRTPNACNVLKKKQNYGEKCLSCGRIQRGNERTCCADSFCWGLCSALEIACASPQLRMTPMVIAIKVAELIVLLWMVTLLNYNRLTNDPMWPKSQNNACMTNLQPRHQSPVWMAGICLWSFPSISYISSLLNFSNLARA